MTLLSVSYRLCRRVLCVMVSIRMQEGHLAIGIFVGCKRLSGALETVSVMPCHWQSIQGWVG